MIILITMVLHYVQSIMSVLVLLHITNLGLKICFENVAVVAFHVMGARFILLSYLLLQDAKTEESASLVTICP